MRKFAKVLVLLLAVCAASSTTAQTITQPSNLLWKPGAGQGLAYGTAGFTAADFNGLANGSVVVAATAIANNTALDQYADVSFTMLNGAVATTATSHLTLYVLPLNVDASTYGDSIASGATAPSASYEVKDVGVKAGVTNAAVVGTWRGIVLPPGSFKFAIVNNLGGALANPATVTISYRTYDN